MLCFLISLLHTKPRVIKNNSDNYNKPNEGMKAPIVILIQKVKFFFVSVAIP